MKIIKEPSWDQNTYILKIDNKLVIIDPGYNYKRIINYLDNQKPDLVLITHFHFDHVANINEICNHYKIKAYIHKNDYNILFDNSLAEFFGYKKVNIDPKNIETFTRKIEILPSLKIIAAPGHSEGSTLYEISGKLFTGDVLFVNAYGRVDFEGSDAKKQIKTLMMIKKLKKNLHIYPGHGSNDVLANIIQNNSFFNDL